jgi:hypothetical protein
MEIQQYNNSSLETLKVINIHLSSCERLKFIIDNEIKTPRRALRLKAFCKEAPRSIFVVISPNKEQLDKLKSDFNLSDSQFISIHDIPDVDKPNRENNPKSVRGVYLFSRYHVSVKIGNTDDVPLDVPWIALDSVKKGTLINFKELSPSIFNDTYFDGIRELLVLAGLFDHKTVLFLGPQAFKKLKDTLKSEMEFETVMITHLKSSEMRERLDNQSLRVIGPKPIHNYVLDALSIPKADNLLNLPEIAKTYLEKQDLFPTSFDTTELANKYPMLFGIRHEEKVINDYIALCDSQERKS